METNSLLQRLEMYAMVISIENDLVENFLQKLTINDIQVEKSKFNGNNIIFENVLRSLDLQSFIEIINNNIVKLSVTKSEKDFVNGSFAKIISIRNKVMHPRLFEFYDCSILKECFNRIEEQVKFIDWKNVAKVKQMINEDPSALMRYEKNLKKSEKTIENLPTVVDFDDTSFIGRRKEISEIKEKLFKKNVHILSILGDGGVGKTAITIKFLYDLLDDENNPFNLILWVSLKTNELNNYEFKQISNAITSTSLMYEKLEQFIGKEIGKTAQDTLIDLSKTFNSLLVLDNLETINTEDIKEFLDNFSENGKVIITSRIGLGEMEHRYFLQGLTDTDLIHYFNTLLELHGKENYFTESEKLFYAKEHLHSNPLAIKWFVRGLANGQTANDLLGNKDDLVNFCMSNVYDKLSKIAKDVLLILKCIRTDITFAELAFLIEKENFIESDVRAAINELCKCNFLQQEKFRVYELLATTDFARDFIKLNVKDDDNTSGRIKQKIKTLNAFDQSMIEKRKNTPYSLQTFYYEYGEKKKIVAAYYLNQAIICNYKGDIDDAFEYIVLAKTLCPKYFECNKIEAYLLRHSDPDKAREEYEIAKQNATTTEQQRLIFINYKEFCLSNNDYWGALNSIESAIVIRDELILQFEKVKILACLSEFEKAEKILDFIESESKQDINNENIFLTRRADIIRRRSELLDQREYKSKFELLKSAAELLLSSTLMDKYSLDYLALILSDMMFNYFDLNVIKYVYSILLKVDKKIYKTKNMTLLRNNILPIKDKIPDFEDKKQLLTMLLDFNSIIDLLEDSEAVVYHLRDNFGFVKNKEYHKGIHFSMYDIKYNIEVGDIVKLGEIFETKKGFLVKNLQLVRKADI